MPLHTAVYSGGACAHIVCAIVVTWLSASSISQNAERMSMGGGGEREVRAALTICFDQSVCT